MSPAPFADRLAHAVSERATCLVVGLDPVIERLPLESRRAAAPDDDPRVAAADAIRHYQSAVIAAVAPYAAAIKPQVAFYERWGPAGWAAYEAAAREARAAGLLVIGDIKRGDVGSTSEAYAEGHLKGPSRSDAVTLNPYLGTDSLAPWLAVVDATNAGAFVLVRTSNPSAAELQELPCAGRPLFEHVAELVNAWGDARVGASGWSSIGAVVGATAPRALAALRAQMPRAWFLIPGVGAQGGAAQDAAAAFDARGLGAIVNSSRSILYAYGDPARTDWRDAIATAARTLRDELRDAARSAAR